MTLKPLTFAERAAAFGTFDYDVLPNGSDIRIKGTWTAQNIVPVECPQLKRLFKRPKIWLHRMAAQPFLDVWQAWEDEGMLEDVVTFNGSWSPRLIRGSTKNLSSHSWGTAFDVNALLNPLGKATPDLGETGSMLRLIPIAERYGWVNGSIFSRSDPMHFEAALGAF